MIEDGGAAPSPCCGIASNAAAGLDVGERQVGRGVRGRAASRAVVVGDGDVAVEGALFGAALLTPSLDLVHEAHMTS